MNMFCYTCCVGFSGMGVVKVSVLEVMQGGWGFGKDWAVK